MLAFKLNKRGLTFGSILFLAVFIALISWLLLPFYFTEVENKQSLSMQVLLIRTAAAEARYFEQHQTYTTNWAELQPLLFLPSGITVRMEAVEGNPSDYFFSFLTSKKRARTDGFIVTLRINENAPGGMITAARVGSVRHQYELLRPFPHGMTECIAEGKNNHAFCRHFLKRAASFELKKIPAAQEPAHDTVPAKI